jgi:hypothetical protein
MGDVGHYRDDISGGPWHLCARCGERRKLYTELFWQRGLLLCNVIPCLDKQLIGQREQKIALVLGDGKEELAPVPKLRDAGIMDIDDDIYID